MRKPTFFLAAVLLVLVADKAPCHEIAPSIDRSSLNSLKYEEIGVQGPIERSTGTGRFLSPDPFIDLKRAPANPQMWNRYAYVGNNPLNRIDPDGRREADVVYRLIRFIYKEGKIIGFETTGTLTRAQAIAAREAGKSIQVTAKTERKALRIAQDIENAAHPDSPNIIHGRDAHARGGNQAHAQSDGQPGHTYYRTFASQPLRSAAELAGSFLLPLKIGLALDLARYGLGKTADSVGEFIDDARQNNLAGGERRGEKTVDELEKNQE